MDQTLNDLVRSYPGRKTQIEQLYNLLGHKDEPLAETLYIYGGPSVGKSAVLNALLKKLQHRNAVVNLIECYSTKILLESILNKLAHHEVTPDNPQPYAKCDNMMEFVGNLKACFEEFDLQLAVVVLDKAERLRDMDFNLLPCFTRLRQLTGLNVCVVFISEIVFQKFYNKGNIVEPVKVRFNQYTKDELLEILSLDYDYACELLSDNHQDLHIDLDFYKNYLNIFLSVFFRACRDLSELRYMSRINFIKYCEPIIRNECKTTESMALWRYICPILKNSLDVLYLRFGSTHAATNQTTDLAQSIELPFYAKYLLIAAYLASYNPAKDDKRLFMKFHGKKRKTLKDIKTKSKVSEQLSTQLGPKPFSFDRLLAIFYAILDDKVGFNNNLLIQVSSLVQLQLMTALSDNCNLDGQKYKCTVGFDFIQSIAKMVGFNIRKYLSDFSHI